MQIKDTPDWLTVSIEHTEVAPKNQISVSWCDSEPSWRVAGFIVKSHNLQNKLKCVFGDTEHLSAP